MKVPILAALVIASALPASSLITPATVAGPSRGIEGETLGLPTAAGAVVADGGASGGRALLVWTTATASAPVDTTSLAAITVIARGDLCGDAPPAMTLSVDGAGIGAWSVGAGWMAYRAPVALGTGRHTLAVSFTNDYVGGGCDRNLYVDRLLLEEPQVSAAPSPGAATAPAQPGPLAGMRLYVDPESNAARQAAAWRTSHPADAAEMEKLALQPVADWFGDSSGPVRAAVAARVATVRAAGAVPLLVAYDIPMRDCGSYSGGGAASPSAYRGWVRDFAAGLGAGPAIVILEPDALALADCLTPAQRTERYALLRDAVSVLKSAPGVHVYVDAGHSAWQPAATIADRLRDAGVDRADGFALNVSNFQRTGDAVAYGQAIAGQLGDAHFVVDTGRNGLGPALDNAWCNPSGRALGRPPTTRTGQPLVDAYLWIKPPGESDGTCNGGPAAGAWWPAYALGLARRTG